MSKTDPKILQELNVEKERLHKIAREDKGSRGAGALRLYHEVEKAIQEYMKTGIKPEIFIEGKLI